MPLISLVMPALNAQETLAESLDSLSKQTFLDFEVVLVNDGSSDNTLLIADEYSKKLNLRVINHAECQGVAASINDGIQQSDSVFIARLDSDDLALPQRLQKQFDFLSQAPQVGVCGTHMTIFSGDRVPHYVLAHPLQNSAIKTAFVQRCAIAHPSVMYRRSVIEHIGGYDTRFDFAEDYELWCRASLLGIQFANIPEELTLYRKHAGQVSQKKAQLQFQRDLAIKTRYLTAWLDGEAPDFLPHFFSLQTQFPSKDIAKAAFQASSHLLMKLARIIPDSEEYAKIVTQSIFRHLS